MQWILEFLSERSGKGKTKYEISSETGTAALRHIRCRDRAHSPYHMRGAFLGQKTKIRRIVIPANVWFSVTSASTA